MYLNMYITRVKVQVLKNIKTKQKTNDKTELLKCVASSNGALNLARMREFCQTAEIQCMVIYMHSEVVK